MKYSLLSMMMMLTLSVSAQLVKDSLKIEGYYRSFQFNKPSTTLKDASLVFVLHGSGGNGQDMMNATSTF
jgi:polyhydroxybutyrate depolymerase